MKSYRFGWSIVALALLVVGGSVARATDEVEKKITCRGTCHVTIDHKGKELGVGLISSFKVLPEEFGGPVELNGKVESVLFRKATAACESNCNYPCIRRRYIANSPFCRLMPTYREIYRWLDAKTEIEFLVAGHDNAMVMKLCNDRWGRCTPVGAALVCEKLAAELGKKVVLPTLSYLNYQNLMLRFALSPVAQAVVDEKFWIASKYPSGDCGAYASGQNCLFDLEKMKATAHTTDHRSNYGGAVCLVVP